MSKRYKEIEGLSESQLLLLSFAAYKCTPLKADDLKMLAVHHPVIEDSTADMHELISRGLYIPAQGINKPILLKHIYYVLEEHTSWPKMFRDEGFMNPHLAQSGHGVAFLVPSVEGSDHMDLRRVRSPYREIDALLIPAHRRMGTELVVDIIMGRVSEKVLIIFGKMIFFSHFCNPSKRIVFASDLPKKPLLS